MPGDGLRWGAMGASWIGRDWVIPALREIGAEVFAVYSRDPTRAAAYSQRTGIPRAYTDVDAFLADPEIEAVYISSTNDLDHEHVLAAAAAGKAILCEKPMTTTLESAHARSTRAARRVWSSPSTTTCATGRPCARCTGSSTTAPLDDRWPSGSSTPSCCRTSYRPGGSAAPRPAGARSST